MAKRRISTKKRDSRIQTLSPGDRDRLDGYELPELRANLKDVDGSADELEHFDEVDPAQAEDGLPIEPKALLDKLKEGIQNLASFSGTTNLSSTPGGKLAQDRGPMPREEFDILAAAVRDSITELKEKTAKLKNLVEVRQAASPTTVSFDPKKKPLLKKGMLRIFKSRNNEITFQQYKAAIKARKILTQKKNRNAFGEGMDYFMRTE